ncbi:transglutaminase family protein [Tianweitania sp. BSSL-BM11]|uniref:Transglutaminase family protein n=1 Tax=Tianweitania aestuarii TaxID=2814886 RepID=A0ABS5RXJ7_9HYPH|nr:transglutaminase family protein [Tianweitania aestuarii]MBS9721764.1 transglutaminase family protein [Tianweitania aestuarii]
MLYDIRLSLHYQYGYPVAGGRHLLRVTPPTLPGIQRVIDSSLTVTPKPGERSDTHDFFRNATTALGFNAPHDSLELVMRARVAVERETAAFDMSPDLDGLAAEIAAIRSLGSRSPHHFRSQTARLPFVPEIAAYAEKSRAPGRSVRATVEDLCRRIYRDFAYDPDATLVDTPIAEAFAGKRGVCQDFAHIMIAACHTLGIPAGYVSGFIRTIPPEGKERLEGADAMHAWVQAWCGREAGWVEFDPTNDMPASDDHIIVALGRDYRDVSPIVGVLQAGGRHSTQQSVDVKPVAEG